MIVRIDKSQYTKVSLNYENNRWAKGQVVMTLTAPDDAAILEYVKAHPRNIVEFFTKCERNRTIGQLEKEHSPVVMDHVKDRFNVMLSAPANMTYFRDTTGFSGLPIMPILGVRILLSMISHIRMLILSQPTI